jgi:hypothetical protein
VSITQEPDPLTLAAGSRSGSRRATADVEVCRPRPVTSLTFPIARRAPGIKALTRVDLPTPE